MTLVDSHVHLDAPVFAADLEQVLLRAREAGVLAMVTVGCLGPDPGTPTTLLRLLDRYPQVAAICGVHPHDARLYDDALENTLLDFLAHPRIVGLGEVGLDFHYDFSPRDTQQAVFRRQLELARTVGKPVVVHTREAEAETAEVLNGMYLGTPVNSGILHCFPGGDRLQQVGLEKGFYFSFGGVVTFKKADAVRRSLLSIPPDRIVLETDAPYLAPVPHRGQRNEPALLPVVAQEVARLREVAPGQVASETTGNCLRLFPELRETGLPPG